MSSLLRTIQRGLACNVASYFFKLGDDGLGLLHWIDRFIERRKVDDMKQQVRPLQMAQKLMA
jgi:hypothetical protein